MLSMCIDHSPKRPFWKMENSRDAGKIDLEYSRLLRFARKLKPDDEIVIEATGNTSAIVRVLLPFVGRVVIANPILVRAIAWAKVKTDKIDAAVLAKLHASGFLPEVWMPDEETEARRRIRFLGRLHQKSSPRSHDRRPRSAKARNRGPEGARSRHYDLWGFEASERLFSRGGNDGRTAL